MSLRYFSTILIYIILIGIIIINCSYFRYYDLKKIIALSSILHLNLTFHSMLSLNSSGIYCAIVIPLSHSLSSIGLSLFMGLLINKTNTRLLDAFFFISSILRLLLLFFLLANNSFPSSINHIGEIFAKKNPSKGMMKVMTRIRQMIDDGIIIKYFCTVAFF